MFSKIVAKICNVFDQEWTQICAILTAAFVAFNSSLMYAWPSPSIPILISDEYPGNITLEQASYTAVIPSISSVLASPLYPYLMDRFGRKIALLSVALPQLLSWILISQANDIYVIYAARFLSGFSNACVYATLPVYIGEIASPNVRGLWGNAMSCLVYFGLFVMNLIGYHFTIQNTAYIFGTLPIIFFLIFIWMPESPYYYIMKNNMDQAKINLMKLRKNKDVDKELMEIKLGIDRQLSEPGSFIDLFRVKSNFKALMIAIFARTAQQFAGISALAVYSQYIFSQVQSHISAGTSAIIYASTLTLFCCTGSFFLDKLGRRWSMIISSMGCGLTLLSLSAYFYLQDYLVQQNIHLPFFPIIGMLVYVPLFCLGLGIVPNLMLGELFSSSIKGKALGLLNICFAINSSLSTKVFQLLLSFNGMYAPFLLFGICCMISTIFSIFYIPETSGKTLEEIQLGLKNKQVQTNTRL